MDFIKMQATGNDFIIIEAIKKEYDWSDLARKMCQRHFGIGADGLITIDKKNSHLVMRIFNADGSEAEVCGNGLRCFAKYVADQGMESKNQFEIITNSGIKRVYVYKAGEKVNSVKVSMGIPKFSAQDIPVNIGEPARANNALDIIYIIDHSIEIDNEQLKLYFVSMGNPHAVHFITFPVDEYALSRIGYSVETHQIFPQRVNFEVARILDRENIEARVWERGVGETMACGSGACAIAAVSIVKGYVDNEVNIRMPGGTLKLQWHGKGDVFLTGPVQEVFSGVWLAD